MSVSEKQWRFLLDFACLIDRISATEGLYATGGELFRTMEQQRLHVDAGRSTTLRSKHLRRLAVDLNFFWHGEYLGVFPVAQQRAILQDIGDYWESLREGNKWGGNWSSFVDTPHFEAN